MKNVIDVVELLSSFGIDFIIVLSILFVTQGIKKYFKCKNKTAFIILIVSGLIVGILKVIGGHAEESLYITVIFGYSGITSLLYIAIDIFLPAIKEKYFPSVKKLNNK